MLRPFKGMCSLRVCLDEVVNGLAQLPEGCHAQPSEGLAPQDAKPAFHLVEPGCVGRRVVKMDQRMFGQPAVMLGLVGTKVVKDNMGWLRPTIKFASDAVRWYAAAGIITTMVTDITAARGPLREPMATPWVCASWRLWRGRALIRSP